MTLEELNRMELLDRAEALQKCCGATAWVDKMNASFPHPTTNSLFEKSTEIWNGLTEKDWREAFTHHPKIGDINSLKEKFANTKAWAEGEQGAVKQASQQVLEALAKGNQEYEAKFGYIFIVCATGKSAEEMLALLQARLPNPLEKEIYNAMAEQDKITRIRLEKLLSS